MEEAAAQEIAGEVAEAQAVLAAVAAALEMGMVTVPAAVVIPVSFVPIFIVPELNTLYRSR